jgi:hypothetical protein
MQRETLDEQLLRAALKINPEGNPGEIYNSRVERVLEDLLNRGEIKDWEANEELLNDEQRGPVDFWVTDLDGNTEGLAVTSTMQKRQRIQKDNANIPIIQVRRGKSGRIKPDHEIKGELRKKLGLK